MSLLLLSSNNAVVAAAAAVDDKDSVLTLSSAIPAANGSQNNTFIDSSVNDAIVTRVGTPTQGSFSPYGDRWSNYFNGTTDYLSTPGSANTQFAGDFTIEISCYYTGTTFAPLLGNYTTDVATDWYIDIAATTNTLRVYTAGATLKFSTVITQNCWNHVALIRSGSVITGYLNGISFGSTTQTGAFGSITKTIYIGLRAGVSVFSGYLSNARIVNGTALYTANFTPPTAPLTAITGTSLLTCQSNQFKNNSINNAPITVAGTPSVTKFSPYVPEAYATSTYGGSLLNQNKTDYCSIPKTASNSTFTGDFTIETWVYPTSGSYPSGWGLLDARTTGGTAMPWTVALDTHVSGRGWLCLFYTGVSHRGTKRVPLNAWTHIAYSRAGSALSFYVNGSLDVSFTLAGTIGGGTGSLFILNTKDLGIANYGGSMGFVADLRIVNGTALYTENFTPPTAPLTPITNTKLLLSGTNAGIIDSTASTDLVTIGSAQVDTAIKPHGTGSMKFNGTTDYLTAPANPNYAFGTDDFTIECWMYPNGAQVSSACLVNINGTTPPFVRLGYENISGRLNIIIGSTWVGTNTTAPVSLTWSHVAAVRMGTTVTMYLNGVGTTPTTNSTAITGGALQIGAYIDSGLFKGNISDLKISKTAKYTANFTPPTGSF